MRSGEAAVADGVEFTAAATAAWSITAVGPAESDGAVIGFGAANGVSCDAVLDDPGAMTALAAHADDASVRERLAAVRLANKRRLAGLIAERFLENGGPGDEDEAAGM